mmetsp:Transcript_14273/g.39338  ORF Transcript_14273/g.39338 Transcript_14273/m.39338 type:complete len:607 (-) Transcript_14273:763-2583(-)
MKQPTANETANMRASAMRSPWLSLTVMQLVLTALLPIANAFAPSLSQPYIQHQSSCDNGQSSVAASGGAMQAYEYPSQPCSWSRPSVALSMADKVEEFRRGINYETSSADKIQNDHNVLDVAMKFGGSSLANHERVDHVAKLIQGQLEKGYRPRAVVCSAMGKTTNNLLSAGESALLDGKVAIDTIRALHEETMDEFDFGDEETCPTRQAVHGLLNECEELLNGVRMIQELSPKSLDQLVSYGERCSVRIMAERLNQLGVRAEAFDAWDVGIQTDSKFGDAKLVSGYETSVKKAFDRIDVNTVAVVTGFIGHEPKGRITTLGRGGSDLTATAIGASLQLDEIQVWKDVDGILTSDPRMVKTAKPVECVSFEEASELAYFGAQVLHPIAMRPAMKYDIPVRVKNSYNPNAKGTIIQKRLPEKDKGRLVTAITYKRNINVLDITSTQMLGAYGFLSRVFSLFAKHKLSVDVLASSEVSISLTLDQKQDVTEVEKVMEDLRDCADVTRKRNRGTITLIADVERSSSVLATVFRVFAKENIQVQMMSQGASKVNISFIIHNSQLEQAILSLHQCFFDDEYSVAPLGYGADGVDALASVITGTDTLVHGEA